MKPEDTYKDPLMQQMFEDAGALRPSSQFTGKILKQLKQEATSGAYSYTPVISKKAWLLVSVLGAAMFVLVFFTSTSPKPSGMVFLGYTIRLDLSFVQRIAEKVAFSFEFSPVMKTSLSALAIFIFAQLLLFEWKNRTIFK